MRTYLLLDREDNNSVDAIITAETTTKEELQELIDKTEKQWKEDDQPEYLTNYIKRALPADCTIITELDKQSYTLFY